MIKPSRLRSGARIAVVSPASAPRPELVQLGMTRLQSEFGYEPVLYPSALTSGPLYYAGDVSSRVRDLHAAFADPSIHAVLCTRGGWGTAELLPHLDFDLIRHHPKPFLGFSDHTTLHIALAQHAGLTTFYAPMVSPDFARGERIATGVHLQSWRSALEDSSPWSVGTHEGMRILRPGAARGTLFGGCLTLLIESLGTSWALTPPPGDSILFLEEVGTRAYQWDRMLLHLQYAGVLDRVRGFVFGDMAQCASHPDEAELIQQAILHRLRDFSGPIAIGLQSGHVDAPNVTLPLNVAARLQCDTTAALHILESAVA